MLFRRLLALATVVALALVTPAVAEVFTYSTAGGGDIEVAVDPNDVVTGMTVSTDLGQIVVIARGDDQTADYDLELLGTGEWIGLTLRDGGFGTTDLTVIYGAAGSVSFKLETDQTLTPLYSTITDCSAVTRSALYQALLGGNAAARAAALDYKRALPEQVHLHYVANTLGIALNSIHLQQDTPCEPMPPSSFWNLCTMQSTNQECLDCCTWATYSATLALALPCGMATAITGPFGTAGCAVALAAAHIVCRLSCDIYIPDQPDTEQGGLCGVWPNYGNCFQICPDDSIDSGQLGCAAPLTCCTFPS